MQYIQACLLTKQYFFWCFDAGLEHMAARPLNGTNFDWLRKLCDISTCDLSPDGNSEKYGRPMKSAIMRKYGLPDPLDLRQCPLSKFAWKRRVNKQINNCWVRFVREQASLYPSLQLLAVDNYATRRSHHLLKSCRNVREITRVHTKLKLATGTYILQTYRATFSQNMVDPTCLLCKSTEETTQHFLVECPELAVTRNPIIDSLLEACCGVCNPAHDNVTLLKLAIDCCALLDINTQNNELSNAEFQARRLCFALDCKRYKKLSLIPRRNRNHKSKKSVCPKSKQGC